MLVLAKVASVALPQLPRLRVIGPGCVLLIAKGADAAPYHLRL